jgi:hypothetical protein
MANKIYIDPETAFTFGSEGGDTVDWTTESVANGAGRQSAIRDLGAGPRSDRYLFEFWTQLQATPTVGSLVRLYIKEYGSESGTEDHPTNDDGTGDAAVSAEDKLRNLRYVGAVTVDEAAANVEMGFKTVVEIAVREFQLVLWNASGAAITADAAETKARLTPIPYEIQ